jgi:hypothetical protein
MGEGDEALTYDTAISIVSLMEKQSGRPKVFTENQILSLLPEGGLTTSEWLSAALQVGMSRATFFRLKAKISILTTLELGSKKWTLLPAVFS